MTRRLTSRSGSRPIFFRPKRIAKSAEVAAELIALKTGRMPSVTYDGHDPHYSGSIAHMVNLIYLDDQEACVLDNNFVGEQELVWLSRADFLQRWTGGSQGWAVILLAPPPPPVPHN